MTKPTMVVGKFWAIDECCVSGPHCNIDSARFVPRPGVPLQRVFHGGDGCDIAGVPVEDAPDHVYDSGERKFSGQEALDGDLVGGIEHGRHRAPGAEAA